MSPFFSICIPVFNGEIYLTECLDSALSQNFTDFEIIIVDDSSTDSSYSILEEYQKKDLRIKLFRNKSNLGLVNNWNMCISKASGKWIKFLLQDDIWLPNCLYKTFQFTSDNDFIFHKREFIFQEYIESRFFDFYTSDLVNDFPALRRGGIFKSSEISTFVSQFPGFNFFGEPSNVAFKNELIPLLGYYNSKLIQLCDYEFFVRIASNRGAYFIPEILSKFRIHNNSTSTSNMLSKNIRFDHLDLLIIINLFTKLAIYKNLRFYWENNNLKDLYKKKEFLLTDLYHTLIRQERLQIKKQIKIYAPFAFHNVIWKNTLKKYIKKLFKNN